MKAGFPRSETLYHCHSGSSPVSGPKGKSEGVRTPLHMGQFARQERARSSRGRGIWAMWLAASEGARWVGMLVKQAKDVARQWVEADATKTPGFQGAYFAGSANWLGDDAGFPATSDLDVYLVVDGPLPPLKLGKFIYRGVLLEVTYLPRDALRSPEAVLGSYHLAGGFRTRSIISDPSG